MNQLLEHFKELTLYPKNAEELKGLILQLAVQGKLTKKWREENPDVEPTSVLFKKIDNEKNEYIKKNKVRKEKTQKLITKDEKPFELPDSWQWSRLQNICYLITDGAHHTPKYIDNGIPFLSVKNLSQGGIDFSDTRFISLKTHRELIKRCNPEFEDILLTKIGTTGIAKVIDVKTDFSIFVSVALLKIAKKNLFPLFIEYCVNSPFIKKQSKDGTEGVGNKNLVLRKIKDFVIPIPPLDEQKAIVATVNQLFAEVEQLETLTKERIQLKADFVTSALNQLTQAAEQDVASHWSFIQQQFGTFFTEKSTIKKLRESILQLAVQGKLTQHWRSLRQAQGPPFEPASELLKKIKVEKEQLIKSGKIKKEKPLPEISEEEMPYDLPEGWVWCRFQEVFDIRDGTHDSPKDAFGDDTFPLITSKNFKNGDINFDSARRISKEDYLKVIQRSQVHKGDILFSMIGGNIGNQVVVGDFTEYAIKNVALFKHYKYGLPTKGFLNLYSQYIALSLQGEAAGGAQPFVSLKYFRNLVLGLPQLEEQTAIVEKVNGLMALCDQLEKEIENHQTTQEQWMQGCLREVVKAKAPNELPLNIAAEPVARDGNK